jgi:hypothetical protein
MLVILSAAIAQAERLGLSGVYILALRDVQDIMLGNEPPFTAQPFWNNIIAESDKRSRSGFAAMSPERLREVSSHGRGNFTVNKLGAIEAGRKGALARIANTTPEQRREWASLGAKAVNSRKRNERPGRRRRS